MDHVLLKNPLAALSGKGNKTGTFENIATQKSEKVVLRRHCPSVELKPSEYVNMLQKTTAPTRSTLFQSKVLPLPRLLGLLRGWCSAL